VVDHLDCKLAACRWGVRLALRAIPIFYLYHKRIELARQL
jgi:hypothetical protein